MKLEGLISEITDLVAPIVESTGYELYHVEYIKEEGEYYLRVYIDKEEGISLEDCEKVSRPISDLLDEKDPIKDSYYLEVSSPGINRYLHSDKHLQKYIGSKVLAKLAKALEGKKIITGILNSYDDKEIIVTDNEVEYKIPKDKIKTINLDGEL